LKNGPTGAYVYSA